MNNESNALQVVEGKLVQSVETIKAPEIVLAEATRAAKALGQVLEQRPKKVIINGKRHLEFDDWQTLGRFYSVSVRTFEAISVEVNGVKGAKARAEVIDAKTGLVVGGAEAYCMRDEDRWSARPKYEWIDGKKTKVGEDPVPFFQLASMAQTRAGAKALRNVLSWVAVLAGFAGTPAEEMEGISDSGSHAPARQKREVFEGEVEHEPELPSYPKPGNQARFISEAQGKRLYAIWKGAGKADAMVKTFLKTNYGIEHTRDITTDIYEEVCEWAGEA